MLRRTGCFLALFSSSGGSAPRSNQPSSGTGTDASASEAGTAGVGVYLPWTARPWAVTYRVHYSQWKFVDTVFAHLATVAPAVLNDRAQQQGVRDVLCELEEPVVALRRQQARHARQLKKQEEALAAVATSSSSEVLESALQGTAIVSTTSPSSAAISDVTAEDTSPATSEAVDHQTALPDANTKLKISRKSRRLKISRKSRKVVQKSAASSVVIYEL
ncbi:hypothetical protein GH5_07819 [Leishmania sp. Ghana 2012 LV757]|uniref:hypothetical protein n=1 Tax=Leishmania sp. Ghana 2012 LV757 TaxID=2803181 RepID=UPI001B7AE4DB|nr:hypothetical protein GH5_07819 [Leishmania sp. Ghana 2012 LV757]